MVLEWPKLGRGVLALQVVYFCSELARPIDSGPAWTIRISNASRTLD